MDTLTVRRPFWSAAAMSIRSITGVSVAVSAPLPERGFLPEVGSGPAGADFFDSLAEADFFAADFFAAFGADFLDDLEDFFFAISRFRIRFVAPQVNKIPPFHSPGVGLKTAI